MATHLQLCEATEVAILVFPWHFLGEGFTIDSTHTVAPRLANTSMACLVKLNY